MLGKKGEFSKKSILDALRASEEIGVQREDKLKTSISGVLRDSEEIRVRREELLKNIHENMGNFKKIGEFNRLFIDFLDLLILRYY